MMISRSYFKLYALVAILFISACSDDDEEGISSGEQLAIDTEIIDNYIVENNITDVVTDASGLRYKIIATGDGLIASNSSNITVHYEGRFLSNGQVFDQSPEDGADFVLGGVIPGWQIGIPKIKEGGEIMLFVPSGLAYGPSGRSGIPGNSILIFDIELVSIN